jgi:NAD(P)-dependent dehydrogenase (short-subunit alcohol dehydrogenase family)
MSAQPRIAIVTGAAGGLGGAVARDLAARGHTVVAVDLDDARVVQACGAGPLALAADLGRWEECERVVAETAARHGGVDVLVNCAAILRRTEPADVGPEAFATVFDVNCRAAFVLMREALVHMERSGWGRIVNVASVGIHTGGYSLTSAVYEASKAAVVSFSKTFARYAAPRGVLINCVAPGGMATRMLTDETPAELLETVIADIPLGRLADPAEVAGMIGYLASEENSYASGATFDVNGGVAMP